MSEVNWEKRARELIVGPDIPSPGYTVEYTRQMALQLGREMADARAEEIAKAIEASPRPYDFRWQFERFKALDIARSFLSKPKTREQVLEEALRYYAGKHLNAGNIFAEETSPGEVARRALDWRPEK